MVAVAIMGVVIAGITTVMDNGNREAKSLQQKIEILQAEQDIMRDLSDPSICGCNFDATKNTANGSPLTFDIGSSASQINLTRLYASCINDVPGLPVAIAGATLPGTQTGVAVSTIRLRNFQSTGTGRFRAELEMAFDHNSLELSRRPASVNVTLNADVTNPSAARVTSCSTSRDPSGAGGGVGNFSCPSVPLSLGYGLTSLPEAPAGMYYAYGSFSMVQPSCGDYHVCEIATTNPVTFAWKSVYSQCPVTSDGP